METPRPRNDSRYLHGQGRPTDWRITAAVLLLALGIVKTTPGQFLSHRIVGGQDSEPGEFPWQACLIYNSYAVCSASLISESWLVTAAHCVHGKNYSKFHVMMGVLNLQGDSPTKMIVRVKSIKMNDIYRGDGTSGDMAILELANPVTFNENIRPIALPAPNQVFPNGMKCWLTGWGRTSEDVKLAPPYPLQKVELPLINSSECNKMFQTAYNHTLSKDPIAEDMICAGYPEGQKDGCQGDSGSGLACPIGDNMVLCGIMSWGEGCAETLKPGVYTYIIKFSAWIQEMTNVATFSDSKTTTTAVAVSRPITEKPKVKSQIDAVTISESNIMTTTVKLTTPIPKDPKVESQACTLSMDQDTTSAGRRLQTSMSVLFVVVVWIRILFFV